MSQREDLRRLYRYYNDVHDNVPVNLRAVIEWAVVEGYYKPLPPQDPIDRAADELAKAVREETAIDPVTKLPYRVNHAVTERGKDGKAHTRWGQIDKVDRDFMKRSLQQRREQIVNDVWALELDKEHYNRIRSEQEPIQILMDFRDDVLDRRHGGSAAA